MEPCDLRTCRDEGNIRAQADASGLLCSHKSVHQNSIYETLQWASKQHVAIAQDIPDSVKVQLPQFMWAVVGKSWKITHFVEHIPKTNQLHLSSLQDIFAKQFETWMCKSNYSLLIEQLQHHKIAPEVILNGALQQSQG